MFMFIWSIYMLTVGVSPFGAASSLWNLSNDTISGNRSGSFICRRNLRSEKGGGGLLEVR